MTRPSIVLGTYEKNEEVKRRVCFGPIQSRGRAACVSPGSGTTCSSRQVTVTRKDASNTSLNSERRDGKPDW